MKAPLMTAHALAILAKVPEGRVELQRQRSRARHQQRQMRAELEAQRMRLQHLDDLVGNIDKLIGRAQP